ncbi:TPA: HAD family phosphatase [Streptococcus suis]|uniref:HAD family hydrolase n=1 Tax=Streptococcus suis TaxID=1307 RepID=UPI000CF3C906|nr:HAD family phosphatase [Streptococcus suis]MCP8329091.1 HAD family phosphatase [Streptococcus suis]MCP8379317.1 HAD family phosphatase [Streptococcus suis]MCP8648255.1 HAD family phosphatase [Streptococcus suis]MDW8715082.1 HAD family phosphatase [Streptococcus suis]NQM33849.1 HAD family phosphatase [Streptococcus suis]
MVAGIIFDMDGVIVDTEYIDFQILTQFICSLTNGSVELSEEEASLLVGSSYTRLHKTIKHLSGTNLDLSTVASQLEKFSQARYDSLDYLSVFRSDILFILDYAKQQGIKLAVASSSSKQHIREIIEACGIAHYFDAIVSGEDFEESKPKPAIYQATLKRLNLTPDKAVAIEDSAYGIQAAQSAGITVIGYLETRFPVDQSKADYIESDMVGILSRIKRLEKEGLN